MQTGVSYNFPEFDGKYERFNNYKVNICQGLPVCPPCDQVFIIHSTNIGVIKTDGWMWGRADKSSKSFFGNVKGVQRAIKYKCSVENCPAVKFVDMAFQYDMSRVYYDNLHKHSQTWK